MGASGNRGQSGFIFNLILTVGAMAYDVPLCEVLESGPVMRLTRLSLKPYVSMPCNVGPDSCRRGCTGARLVVYGSR